MPLPAGPPRKWRPVVDRCLVAFNGLVLVWIVFTGGHSPNGVNALFALGPTLAMWGFAGRARRQLRAWAIVPSGVCCIFGGLFGAVSIPFVSAYTEHQAACHLHPIQHASVALPVVLSLFVALLGALMLESAIARLRRS